MLDAFSFAMASSKVRDVPEGAGGAAAVSVECAAATAAGLEEAEARRDLSTTPEGMFRAMMRQGHMTTVGALVLFASDPPAEDMMNQWSIRPTSSFYTVPKFVSPGTRLTAVERVTNVLLSRRGTKSAVFNVFARIESGMSPGISLEFPAFPLLCYRVWHFMAELPAGM